MHPLNAEPRCGWSVGKFTADPILDIERTIIIVLNDYAPIAGHISQKYRAILGCNLHSVPGEYFCGQTR